MTHKEIYNRLCTIENQISSLMNDIEPLTPMWWDLDKICDDLADLESDALAISLREASDDR